MSTCYKSTLELELIGVILYRVNDMRFKINEIDNRSNLNYSKTNFLFI